MSANPIPLRRVRLVSYASDNAVIWIVDASDRDSIVCHVLHFDSPEEAASAERTITSHIDSDRSIDELIELAGVEESSCDRDAFGDPEEIVDYFGGDADQALRGDARKMLADMAIERD
jgi:hypothetical protein